MYIIGTCNLWIPQMSLFAVCPFPGKSWQVDQWIPVVDSCCASGTCESIDLEKKELLVRPYPVGLEKDFTVPYDVP